MDWHFQSGLTGITWPAVPDYGRAAVLALLHQMEQTQWWPAARIEAEQQRQLAALLRHAWETVPFYRESWQGRYDPSAPLSRQVFAGLPILARRDLQDRYAALHSRALPPGHGRPVEGRSSGSTGAPVRILATDVTALRWRAFTLRDHAWHGRQLDRKLAVIRNSVQPGSAPSWGVATAGLVQTGECVTLNVEPDVEAQLEWLARERPGYLLSYSSLVRALARASLRSKVRLHGLLEVRTFGEALAPDDREICREAWGVPLTDFYSAEEVGYIALQCPERAHYHVQAEGVFVEILDEAGNPCAPGRLGRVVVTDLHNFAMPLVRYEIGDYAEPGEPCSCGRGLPVLNRILGRVRNLLVGADGRRYWPVFGTNRMFEVAPILQHQIVQKQADLIEARLVVAAPLDARQEQRLREVILANMPPGMTLEFSYRDRIERGAGGKFEDFVCEVAPQP